MVSIVVPSYNGAKHLPNLLAKLSEQTYLAFELIVVLDGSTDDSEAVLHAQQTPFHVIIINQHNQGRASTRNNGAQYAFNDLLIFFDDDMLPEPNCVEEHVKFHEQNPHSILVGGTDTVLTNNKTEAQRYKLWVEAQWHKVMPQTRTTLSKDSPFIASANFSISKALFEELGRFETGLKDSEDRDLAIRASEAGILIVLDPKILAWHNEPPVTFYSYIRRQIQYRVANQKLCELRPRYTTDYPAIFPPFQPSSKRLFYWLITWFGWVSLLDSSNILTYLMPRAWRYKFYTYLITGFSVYYPKRFRFSKGLR